MAASLELSRVEKRFPRGIAALDGIDLAIASGEIVTVLGPSGSGKSTLLGVIAGLERPDAGEVRIGGRRAERLPPWRRDVAMVFQQPAAYPHLSVRDNLAFGLRARGAGRDEVRRGVDEVADRLGLATMLDRRPAELSGGERQRVAIGRALARKPAVLLLDEPFSALDAPLRTALRVDLAEWQRHFGVTTVHVTHDQAEALALGTRVAVIERGRIAQVGPPDEVYARPASLFVAGFIGSPPMNLLPASVEFEADRLILHLDGAFECPRGQAWQAPLERRGPGPVVVGIRPEHVHVAGSGLRVEGVVEQVEPLGHETLATVTLSTGRVVVRLTPSAGLRVGDRVGLGLDLGRASWFDPGTGVRLG